MNCLCIENKAIQPECRSLQ